MSILTDPKKNCAKYQISKIASNKINVAYGVSKKCGIKISERQRKKIIL